MEQLVQNVSVSKTEESEVGSRLQVTSSRNSRAFNTTNIQDLEVPRLPVSIPTHNPSAFAWSTTSLEFDGSDTTTTNDTRLDEDVSSTFHKQWRNDLLRVKETSLSRYCRMLLPSSSSLP